MQTADSEHLVALIVPVVLPAAVGSVLPDKSSLVSAPVLLTILWGCVRCVCVCVGGVCGVCGGVECVGCGVCGVCEGYKLYDRFSSTIHGPVKNKN